jgi:hypothetical protein
MRTTDREYSETTGRAAAGRAVPFNPEEQHSPRFRSYGPPLPEVIAKNGIVLPGSLISVLRTSFRFGKNRTKEPIQICHA